MTTRRLTMAQALVEFLANQHSERDGNTQRLFAGCFGIFGHGNVAGIGQALRQYSDLLPYHMARNEQSMVHIASGYAKHRNRLSTFACTSSIGPGATNMVTGAATATVNRLPVLLLPGDIFASRRPDPVLLVELGPGRGTMMRDALRALRRARGPLVPAAFAGLIAFVERRTLGSAASLAGDDLRGKRIGVTGLPSDEAVLRALDLRQIDQPALALADDLDWSGERREREDAALAVVVGAQDEDAVLDRDDERERPEDHPYLAEDAELEMECNLRRHLR